MLSLPDWAFYPLAAAVSAGMVAGAMSFGESHYRTPEEIRAEGIVFEAADLAGLTLGNGLEAEFLSENGQTFARISAARGPLDGLQSAGAFFTLSPEALEAMSGHRVSVAFTLRRAEASAAEHTLLNVFVPGRAQGDWQRVEISDSFEVVTLPIEPSTCELTYAYAGVWPDWAANANVVDLLKVEVTIQESLAC